MSKAARRETHVIAIGNQKGGVGKTTMTAHLAASLGERGLSVLAIDLDMNYGLTQHFGVDPEAFLGTYEVLIGEENPEDVIITNDDEGVQLPPGVHLIASRRKLEDIDRALTAKGKFVIPQNALLRPVERLLALNQYDVILLDTAPNATPPTLAAYRCSHWFLLTATPDPFATRGLNDALHDIRDAQENGNRELRLLGVALSAVDQRTRLASSLSEYVERAFIVDDGSTLKFKTEISRSTAIPSAQKAGATVLQTRPSHIIARQYRGLAAEVCDRLRPKASVETEGAPPSQVMGCVTGMTLHG
jgi:chromosome partitioning protein